MCHSKSYTSGYIISFMINNLPCLVGNILPPVKAYVSHHLFREVFPHSLILVVFNWATVGKLKGFPKEYQIFLVPIFTCLQLTFLNC